MGRLFTTNELSSQDFLDFKDEKYVVSYLSSGASFVAHLVKNLPAMHLGRAQPLLQTVLLLIFWSYYPQGENSNAFLGGPGEVHLPLTSKSL